MLAELEDWDTYKGASTAGEKPLKTPSVKIKDDLKVALSSPPKARQTQLRHIFRSWKHGLDGGRKDDAAPPLLACFFASQYEAASFKTSSLKEADATLLKDVAPLAKAYGFALHFAHATYTQIGDLTFDESSYYQRGVTRSHVMDNPDYDYRYHYDDDDLYEYEVDAMKAEIEEVEREYASFSQVFCLDGMPTDMYGLAADKVSDNVFINGKITDCLNGKASEYIKTATFEQEDGHCGTLFHEYRRCALVITPAKSDAVKFRLSLQVAAFACPILKSSVSKTPTPQEKRLVPKLSALLNQHARLSSEKDPQKAASSKEVLESLDKVLPQIGEALGKCALRWNSPGILASISKDRVERMISLIGIESLVLAYQKFPWVQLRDLYAEGVAKTPSNSLRGQLLSRLLTAAIERHDSIVISWCQAQSKPVLDEIRKVEANELEWIMMIVKSMPDGTDYLRSSLIPRLQNERPSDFGFWNAFVTRLHDLSHSQFKSSGWRVAEHPGLIDNCLSNLANNIKIYAFKDQELQHGRCGYSMPDIVNVDVVISLFELGIRLGAVQACMNVLQRFWDGKEKQRDSATHYSALVDKFDCLVRDNVKINFRQSLQPFFRQAAAVLLAAYASQSNACSVVLRLLDDGITILTAFYTEDRVKQLGKSRPKLADFTVMAASLRSQATTPKLTADLEALLKLCLEESINGFSTGTYYDVSRDGIALLKMCYTLQMPSYSAKIIEKFLQLPEQHASEYVASNLVPLVKRLPAFLEEQKLPFDGPYAKLASSVTTMYVRDTVGARPDEVIPLDKLKAIPCASLCFTCKEHLDPFLSGNYRIAHVSEKQSIRTHLEKRLEKTSAWGFKWHTIKTGSPHTLVMEKPQSVCDLAKWVASQTEAQNLLKAMGDEGKQREILGADYDWVSAAIEGTTPPPKAHTSAAKKRPSDAAASRSTLIVVPCNTGFSVAQFVVSIRDPVVAWSQNQLRRASVGQIAHKLENEVLLDSRGDFGLTWRNGRYHVSQRDLFSTPDAQRHCSVQERIPLPGMSSHCQNCDPRSFFEAQSSPFHAHLGSCIAFDTPPPERRAILDYVRKIERDMASCGERIVHLTGALKTLEEMRRAYIELFPPIHTLPVEVLLKIFNLAVPKPYDYFSITGGPWGLGHVCRLWRQITSAPSSLWTWSRYTGPSSSLGYFADGNCSMLSTVFERSSPLTFDCELDPSGRAIVILKRHSLRWYDIVLCGKAQDILKLQDGGQLPLLATVVLKIRDSEGITQHTLAQILEIFQHAPYLQALGLLGSPPKGIPDLVSVFPWHQLRHLGVSLSSTFLLDCQLLAHCPHLQSYLTTSVQEPGPVDAVLPWKLKLLAVEHVGLLRYLQCAALAEFRVAVSRSSNMYEGDDILEDCVLALRTFLAQSPLLATVCVNASYTLRRVSSLLSTFTSASIRTFKLEVPAYSQDLKLLAASATSLVLPHMIHFECTSSGSMTVEFAQSLLDVIKSRWQVERREVARLRSIRLCFKSVVVGGVEKLSFMMDCLRVLKAEGLDGLSVLQ